MIERRETPRCILPIPYGGHPMVKLSMTNEVVLERGNLVAVEESRYEQYFEDGEEGFKKPDAPIRVYRTQLRVEWGDEDIVPPSKAASLEELRLFLNHERMLRDAIARGQILVVRVQAVPEIPAADEDATEEERSLIEAARPAMEAARSEFLNAKRFRFDDILDLPRLRKESNKSTIGVFDDYDRNDRKNRHERAQLWIGTSGVKETRQDEERGKHTTETTVVSVVHLFIPQESRRKREPVLFLIDLAVCDLADRGYLWHLSGQEAFFPRFLKKHEAVAPTPPASDDGGRGKKRDGRRRDGKSGEVGSENDDGKSADASANPSDDAPIPWTAPTPPPTLGNMLQSKGQTLDAIAANAAAEPEVATATTEPPPQAAPEAALT